MGGADQKQLLAGFRELAFRALYHAEAFRLKAEAAITELDAERVVTEERLSKVIDSPIWRTTQALKKLAGISRNTF